MIHLRKNNKKKNFNDSINLIPMINLIFLLLIFFLLTGVVQKKDEVEVTIPESFFGKKKIELKETITVKKDGSFLWNNREVKIEDILNILENKSNIIVNIDEEASIEKFNELIKLYKLKGLKKIFINVKHKK